MTGKEGKYQVILKKIDLPIIPRVPCVERLRSTRLGYHFNLHPSFICAGIVFFFEYVEPLKSKQINKLFYQLFVGDT